MNIKIFPFKSNRYSFIGCLILFFIMFFSNVNGQDEDILLTSWFLESLIINEEEFPFLPNNEINSIVLFFDFLSEEEPITYSSSVCYDLYGTANFFQTNDGSFVQLNNLSLEPYIECQLEENLTYDALYFDFLLNLNDITYAYDIIVNTNFSTLILTSSTGNKAIYNTTNLAVQDFLKPTFTVYPNPVKDILHIENPADIPLLEIVIYNSLGKQLINIPEPTDTIDMSNLSKGIYFITLRTSTTITNKKIIVR